MRISEEDKIIGLLRKHGIDVELGTNFSVKCQIAQLLNVISEIQDGKSIRFDTNVSLWDRCFNPTMGKGIAMRISKEELIRLKEIRTDLAIIWNRLHNSYIDDGISVDQLRYIYNLQRLREALGFIEKFIFVEEQNVTDMGEIKDSSERESKSSGFYDSGNIYREVDQEAE